MAMIKRFLKHFIIISLFIVAVLAFDKDKLSNSIYNLQLKFGHIRDGIYNTLGQKRAVEKQKKFISTALLDIEVLEIDTGLTVGFGGGLTSFHDQLILLTGEGQIYVVGKNGVDETEITTPPFNRKSMEDFSDKHNLGITSKELRYNDILYSELLDPDAIFISYSFWNNNDNCYTNRVARLEIDKNVRSLSKVRSSAKDWRILHETRPCLPFKDKSEADEIFVGRQAGGRMAALGPNSMVLTVGDYGFDGVNSEVVHPQLADSDYGKILELNTKTGQAKFISTGNRNPQGVLVDDQGTIWSVEHGPRGGDELNRIRAGQNFGWPYATYGTDYTSYSWPLSDRLGRHDGYTPAVYAWVPSRGISNFVQIKDFPVEWDQDFLVASLKGARLFRLRLDGDRVVYAEPIGIGEHIRYVHQHTDGAIVLWTDRRKIIYLNPVQSVSVESLIEKALSSYNAEQRTAIRAAFKRCIECHSIRAGQHQTGPSLAGVHGRRIADTSYENYSSALKAKGGNWGDENLKNFIKDPNGFAAGTVMPDSGVGSDDIAKGIVEMLKSF